MASTRLTAAEAAWCLVASAGQSGTPRKVRVHASPFLVGRRPEMQLTLTCTSVSGRHAELVCEHDVLWVRDLGSTNGTYVNGEPVTTSMQLKEGDYLQFAKVVFRVGRELAISNSRTSVGAACDEALALIQFDKLMSQRGVTPYFQPIVRVADDQCVGYEVLARSRLFGLQTPSAMFSAAKMLELESELSRMCRAEAMLSATTLVQPHVLFLNTHPREMSDLPKLIESLRGMRDQYPGHKLCLEIHEAAVTEPQEMHELRAVLTELEILLAYDDFGSGQARFVELVEVPPHFLKFDMKLIQGIHQASAARQQMLATLVRMARDLGIETLAEGVECRDENKTCIQMGFDLGQGFLYGRPAPVNVYRKTVDEAKTNDEELAAKDCR